jgi:transcription-repair coupling factor (superfamily II helicase)
MVDGGGNFRPAAAVDCQAMDEHHLWDEASRRLRASAPYRALLAGAEEAVRLPVPAAAWVVELAAEETGRPALVVVPHESDALAWIEAARLFAPASRREAAVYFPGPSLSPYQETETSLPVRAQEAVALDRLLCGTGGGGAPPLTLVTTPRALFRRLPPADRFRAAVVALAPGDDAPVELLAELLLAAGYRRSDLVTEVGDFAVRGFVFDVYPPGVDDPVRIELFGDTVESIRLFDAVSQRSEERLGEVRLLPLAPFAAGPAEAAELAAVLADFAGERLGPEAAGHLEALRERGGFPGWQNYLPLLAADTRSLAELAAEAGGASGVLTVAVDPPALDAEAEHHAETLAADFASRQSHHKLVAPPEALEQPLDEVRGALAAATVRVGGLVLQESALRPGTGQGPGDGRVDFAASSTDLFQGQLPRFPHEVATARARGDRCVVVAAAAHRQRTEELLAGRGIEIGAGGCSVVAGELARGFRLPAAGVSVYAEQQLLPRARPQQAARRKVRFGPFVSSLRDLKVGDFVVHQDHGIGQFVALRRVGGSEGDARLPPVIAGLGGGGSALDTEVMEISYASGRSLLVPLSRLDLVQKFSGIEGVSPRLDTLGGTSWNKTKARVKNSLRDMAGELLKLYAERQLARAPAMPADSDLLGQFEAAFAYEETPDQLDAIAAVKDDLQRERPMDRLLCGDVGYGKTEVAMRAAFKAVDGGYQVAMLAPTTVLADQHLETFRRRFAGFPVTIEMLSRFRRRPRSSRDPRQARRRQGRHVDRHPPAAVEGRRFAELGLVVVDEEQRFGVAQKERLKQLKKDVHVLRCRRRRCRARCSCRSPACATCR